MMGAQLATWLSVYQVCRQAGDAHDEAAKNAAAAVEATKGYN